MNDQARTYETPIDNLKAAPVGCPLCGDPTIVQLPDDWQEQVDEGYKVEAIGCGNPWHYRFPTVEADVVTPAPIVLPVDDNGASVQAAIIGLGLLFAIVGIVVGIFIGRSLAG